MTESRTEAPPLSEPEPPDCSICGRRTTADDRGYYCKFCECLWDYDTYTSFGQWDDTESRQCPYRFVFDQNETWQCLLATGHPDEHQHPRVGYPPGDWTTT